MVISREIDYAVRILRHLSSVDMCNAAEIESAENISRDFVRKILGKLKKVGYVTTERGTKGGYRINISLDTLNLLDVKNAVEPGPVINKCLNSGFICENNCNEGCGVHRECERLESILVSEMKRKSLAEIIKS